MQLTKLTIDFEQDIHGWRAFIREIEGCTATGYTIEEAKDNALNLIRLFREETHIDIAENPHLIYNVTRLI